MELVASFDSLAVRRYALSALNKDCIVFMVKAIKGSDGEYARMDKAAYVDLLSTESADAVNTAYRNWLDLRAVGAPNPTQKEPQ